jgi:hypothetical protein
MRLRFQDRGLKEKFKDEKTLNDIRQHHNDMIDRFGPILFILLAGSLKYKVCPPKSKSAAFRLSDAD